MSKALRAIRYELRDLLPTVAFFAVAFNLVVVTDALTTEAYGIRVFHVVSALVLALVVGKAIVVANHLRFTDAFPDKPLIYNTVWKTLLYSTMVLILRYVEKLIPLVSKYGGLTAANDHLLREMVWSRFWAIHIWITGLVLAYVAFQELSRALGNGKLRRMFFGR